MNLKEKYHKKKMKIHEHGTYIFPITFFSFSVVYSSFFLKKEIKKE